MATRNKNQKWVKTPVQSRSQRTMNALLDATESLLRDRPFSTVSVADITRKANSSVGAFYARFEDKTAMLHALHERYVIDLKGELDARFQGAHFVDEDMPTWVRKLCHFCVEHAQRFVGIRRGALLMGSENDAFRERNAELAQHHVEAFERVFVERLNLSAPREVAASVERVLFGVIDRHALQESALQTRDPEAHHFPLEPEDICLWLECYLARLSAS